MVHVTYLPKLVLVHVTYLPMVCNWGGHSLTHELITYATYMYIHAGSKATSCAELGGNLR